MTKGASKDLSGIGGVMRSRQGTVQGWARNVYMLYPFRPSPVDGSLHVTVRLQGWAWALTGDTSMLCLQSRDSQQPPGLLPSGMWAVYA